MGDERESHENMGTTLKQAQTEHWFREMNSDSPLTAAWRVPLRRPHEKEGRGSRPRILLPEDHTDWANCGTGEDAPGQGIWSLIFFASFCVEMVMTVQYCRYLSNPMLRVHEAFPRLEFVGASYLIQKNRLEQNIRPRHD